MVIVRQEGLAMVENLLNMVYEKCLWDYGGWVILLLVYCSRKSRQERCVQSNRLYAMEVMWVGAPEQQLRHVHGRGDWLSWYQANYCPHQMMHHAQCGEKTCVGYCCVAYTVVDCV